MIAWGQSGAFRPIQTMFATVAVAAAIHLSCGSESPANMEMNDQDRAVGECLRSGPVGKFTKLEISAVRWSRTAMESSPDSVRDNPAIRLEVQQEFLICRWVVILGEEPFSTPSGAGKIKATAVVDIHYSTGKTKTFVLTNTEVYSTSTGTRRAMDPYLRRIIQGLTFDVRDQGEAWSKP